MSYSLVFIVLCKIFLSVQGWGPVGHSVIARLAQSQLTESASNRINYLVPWHWKGNLSAMASWADDILYSDTNPTGFGNWQWTRPLHYVNIPDWSCNYQYERDCIDDMCAEGAIRNYTKRLESNLDDIQHQEALYFLIHYVGDLHQPLHTGFEGDRGGNSVRGRFMNGTYEANLHSLWDSGLITARLRRDFRSNNSLYYEHIHQLMLRQSSTGDEDDIQQWVKENINIVCSQAYLNEQNTTMNASVKFELGEIYYQRNIEIIEQRLARGGRRLAALLNRLQTPSITTNKDKLCISTYILIGVLAVEFIIGVALGIYFFIRYKAKRQQT